MTDWSSVRVTCPYYMGERDNYITCEGVIPNTKINLIFSTKDRKKSFKRDNCERFKRDCPIHKALEERYERH